MINKDNLTQHISAQFNAELEEVRSHLLAMGGLVEKQVNDAVTSLIEADSGLAQQVREIDQQINQMESSIDEECVRILARRQPAASDLRLLRATDAPKLSLASSLALKSTFLPPLS